MIYEGKYVNFTFKVQSEIFSLKNCMHEKQHF